MFSFSLSFCLISCNKSLIRLAVNHLIYIPHTLRHVSASVSLNKWVHIECLTEIGIEQANYGLN